jgi:hypothetical protein
MRQRKNSWMIFTDGKKEKILNYINIENQFILFFTHSGTYLYFHKLPYWDCDHKFDTHCNSSSIIKITDRFYQCRTHHNINVANPEQWLNVDNIDRIEIII